MWQNTWSSVRGPGNLWHHSAAARLWKHNGWWSPETWRPNTHVHSAGNSEQFRSTKRQRVTPDELKLQIYCQRCSSVNTTVSLEGSGEGHKSLRRRLLTLHQQLDPLFDTKVQKAREAKRKTFDITFEYSRCFDDHYCVCCRCDNHFSYNVLR